MSTDVLHPVDTSAFGNPGAILTALVDLVLRPSVPRKFRPLAELLESGARRFGGPILEAGSLEELEARIEAGLEDAEYWNWRSLLMAEAVKHWPAIHDTVSQTQEEACGLHWSEAGRRVFRGATRDFNAALTHTVWSSLAVARELSNAALSAAVTPDMNALLADMSIPVVVKECLLAGMRAEVEQVAVVELLRREHSVEPWLVAGLGARWRADSFEFLRFIASTPEAAQVPEHIVPTDQLLDITTLEEHQKQIAASLNERSRLARLKLSTGAAYAQHFPEHGPLVLDD